MKRSYIRRFIIVRLMTHWKKPAYRRSISLEVAMELKTTGLNRPGQYLIPARTIQRDLRSLVEMGVVLRQGRAKASQYVLSERAWDRVRAAQAASAPDRKQWARWTSPRCTPGHAHPLIDRAVLKLLQGELRTQKRGRSRHSRPSIVLRRLRMDQPWDPGPR